MTDPITTKILTAIDQCFTASQAPPTSGDIAAAVLRALADAQPSAQHWHCDDLRTLADQMDGAMSPSEHLVGLTDAQLEALFRTWWQQSYPTPPGNHALMTHIGWARFLLEQVGYQGQHREQER